MNIKRKTAGILLALLPLLVVPAASTLAKEPADPTADPLMVTAGFLSGHPDLRYRLLGLEDFKRGRHADALRFFRRASFYSDKPSQGMVAEMYWTGQGVERDPVAAYIWMDLAAERGYEGFLILRERYWQGLDEAQRRLAVELGQDVYAKYGDAAAQPRLASVMRRVRNNVTGSRTGSVGNVQILVPMPGGMQQIDGSKFYDEQFWDPQQYQAWQDAVWKRFRVGRVTVGELVSVPENGIPDGGSRIPDTAPAHDAPEPETPARDERALGTRDD